MLENIKRTKSDIVLDAINVFVVVILLGLITYPLYFVLIASVSDVSKLYGQTLVLWPVNFHLGSYIRVFENREIWVGFKNSVIYTGLGTAINLAMTTLAAYPLSRRFFYGKSLFTIFFVFTMFFSGGLIPTYLVNKSLGLLDTVWVMVLPGAISVFLMIIMRTFFQTTIPFELEESAVIDGCNDFQLLWRIVIPLSAPVLAVMALFYGVGHWNSYFQAMIYLNNRDHFPLQLILREILVQGKMTGLGDLQMIETMKGAEFAKRKAIIDGVKYSTVIISSLPVLIIYPMLRKFFNKGLMIGAIKG